MKPFMRLNNNLHFPELIGDMGMDQRAYGPSTVETIIPCPSATSRCPQKTVMETQLISTDAEGSKFGVEITEKKKLN